VSASIVNAGHLLNLAPQEHVELSDGSQSTSARLLQIGEHVVTIAGFSGVVIEVDPFSGAVVQLDGLAVP
jgi:hypothetical protein